MIRLLLRTVDWLSYYGYPITKEKLSRYLNIVNRLSSNMTSRLLKKIVESSSSTSMRTTSKRDLPRVGDIIVLSDEIRGRGLSAGHVLKYRNGWPIKDDIGLIISDHDFAHPTGHRVTILWQDKNITSHYIERISFVVVKNDE